MKKGGSTSAYDFYKSIKHKDGDGVKHKHPKEKKQVDAAFQPEKSKVKKRQMQETETKQPMPKKSKTVHFESEEKGGKWEIEKKILFKEIGAGKGGEKVQSPKEKKQVDIAFQSEKSPAKKHQTQEFEFKQPLPKSPKKSKSAHIEPKEKREKDLLKELRAGKGNEEVQPEFLKLSKSQRKKMKKKAKEASASVGQVPAKSPLKVQLQSLLKEKREKIQEDKRKAASPTPVLEYGDEVSDESSESSGGLPEPLNPYEEGRNILKEMLHPTSIEDFFQNYWEKKVLHVKRKNPEYYGGWLSTSEMDEMLRENRVMFTEHLDVTSYKDGVRTTLNPEGRAFPAIVWDYFRTGCSVRMLCPQTFADQLAFNLNVLQEYFGCFVGANTYLTPPGMQGFAPHYDDIEAFILQLEGSKKWRIYNPRNASEKLPRFSSGNFKQNEVGQPLMEVTLRAGDMLYFPRGMIHQAVCPDDDYSFHLTVSTNQKNSWGDLLLKLLPAAVETAMANDVRFRKGLPPGYLRHMGTCVTGKEGRHRKQRDKTISHVKNLAEILINQYLPIDRACDEMGKQLANDSLPPILEENEARHHISQQGERWSEVAPGVVNAVEISPDTEIRLVRFSAVRCIRTSEGSTSKAREMEEEEEDRKAVAQLYHSICNTRVYREVEPIFSSVSAEALPCIEKLIEAFPSFVRVEDFPLTDLDEKLSVASSLYDMGLVITRQPLEGIEDDPSESDD